MDNTIKMAREIGKAIQADARYKAYHEAKELNDNDKELQDLIGEFNLIRQNLGMEANKQGEERSEDKITQLNNDAQAAYAKIMDNENMKAFTDAKNAMDALIRDISTIISLCCDGEDPDTCSIEPQGGCASGGGCSGCGKH
jgi:cell fate (sporulation/competence/biofilm development) regulator YlbF (YheA/YmcA/DUF963 family)